MNFEKIRLETVEFYKDRINRENENDPFANLVEQIIEISSKVSRTMIEKYHQELNKTDWFR